VSATRIALLISLLASAAQRVPAQQPLDIAPAVAAQSPANLRDTTDSIPTIHVTTRIVVLDVVVNDGHGHPVTGLKPSDLILTEDGVPQTIDSFTEHDATTSAPPATAASDSQLPLNTFTVQSPATGRGASTVIVLGNVDWTHAPFVRDQLKEFLAASPIGIPVAIFRQDWQGMHLVQGLTLNRNILLDAASSQRLLPPLGFQVRYARSTTPPAANLARYLAAIPGRINLVWFGEAPPSGNDEGLFPDLDGSGLPPELAGLMRTADADAAGVRRLSRIAIYPVLADGLPPPLVCEDQYCAENVARITAARAIPCEKILEAAIDAGGKAFCNTNGFKEALTEVETTGSDYYTISYLPTNPKWNGAYRTIRIDYGPRESMGQQLADYLVLGPAYFRSNLTYRHGYYARDTPPAPTSDASTSLRANPQLTSVAGPQRKLISASPRGNPAPTPMERAMAFGTQTPAEVHFTIVVTPSSQVEALKPNQPLPPENYLTAPFRNTSYRNARIHYWIDPQDLHFTPTPAEAYRTDLQFVAIVYRDDGLLANSLSYTSHVQVSPNQLEDILINGLTFDQTIAIPVSGNPLPGQFFLRAGVADLAAKHIGALEIPTEQIKLPSEQAAGNNAAADRAQSNTPPK
jgi:VWFA-related protein